MVSGVFLDLPDPVHTAEFLAENLLQSRMGGEQWWAVAVVCCSSAAAMACPDEMALLARLLVADHEPTPVASGPGQAVRQAPLAEVAAESSAPAVTDAFLPSHPRPS